MKQDWTEKQIAAAEVMGFVLHAANPTRTPEEWTQHTLETGHDAKSFFGSNGVGYEEYIGFVNRNDKDRVEKIMKDKARKKALEKRGH